MIGVAFALQETFGKGSGIERAALGASPAEFAAKHGWHVDVGMLERIANVDAAVLSTPVALAGAFWPRLAEPLDGVHLERLEAMFRMAAAGAVDERFVPYADVRPALRKVAEMQIPRVALSGGWPTIDQRKADTAGFDAKDRLPTGDLASRQRSGRFRAGRWDPHLSAVSLCPVCRERSGIGNSSGRGDGDADDLGESRRRWFPAGARAPTATIESLEALIEVLGEPYTRGLLALRHILRTALDYRPDISFRATTRRHDGRVRTWLQTLGRRRPDYRRVMIASATNFKTRRKTMAFMAGLKKFAMSGAGTRRSRAQPAPTDLYNIDAMIGRDPSISPVGAPPTQLLNNAEQNRAPAQPSAGPEAPGRPTQQPEPMQATAGPGPKGDAADL